ncbi:MAG: endonuclease [[Clostridium] fimetarium]|nr:endonuclease [Alistipes timonensis]MCM1405631.1 endonuclease [[Clostridium] fimetarium]
MRFSTFMLAAAALTVSSAALAEVPRGYYNSLTGKKEAALKDAIHTLTYNHTLVSSYSDLPQYFRSTDVYPRGNDRYGEWWDMYGNIPLYTNSFWGLNREHSFPKSWWGGGTATPAYTDLNHLYPSEKNANMAKSNYPLGLVQTPTFDNGVTKVGYAQTGFGFGAPQVFEPADEYKGDFARTYFYMVCCYQNLTWRYTYMVNNNDYPTLNSRAQEMLLKWSREDPVSQKELDRNEQVYRFQANRNPFIDYPELAEYLWGNRKGLPFDPYASQEPESDPVLITPVQGMALDFGEVATGGSGEASLQFRGQDIKQNLSIRVIGDNPGMFVPEVTSIPYNRVNTDNGTWLKISYRPTSLGEHSATLLVYDYADGGSRGVTLHGSCLPVPELHSFKALPATDVTATSYIARWEVPTYNGVEDVVDYYVVTRSHTNNGQSSEEDHVAENDYLEITDCEPGTIESYRVRSCRLGYYSEPTDWITVNLTTGLSDVAADNPLGTAFEPGGVRFVCGAPHKDVSIYDLSGRLVRFLPVVENNMTVALPYGAYVISSPTQRVPLRVLVAD